MKERVNRTEQRETSSLTGNCIRCVLFREPCDHTELPTVSGMLDLPFYFTGRKERFSRQAVQGTAFVRW